VVVCPSNRSPRIFDASVTFELWALVPRIVLLRPGASSYYSSTGFPSLELPSLGHQRLYDIPAWALNLQADSFKAVVPLC
jgi:hypothetical protein